MHTSIHNISEELRQTFLTTLAEAGDVRAAATAVGISEQWLSDLRRSDPEFSAEWDGAYRSWTARLEHEALERALTGVVRPLASEGKLVRDDDGKLVTERHYSDDLLLAILKAHEPNKYSHTQKFELTIRPKWLQYLLMIFVLSFSIWVFGELTLHAISDHAGGVGL